MTIEEIRRIFSNPPAKYPKQVDNQGDICPWCGKLTEYRRDERNQACGWKCPGCQREGYFSVKYQFDPLDAPRDLPIAQGDPCPHCGNPVKNIWKDGSPTLKGDEYWCPQCREQGKYLPGLSFMDHLKRHGWEGINILDTRDPGDMEIIRRHEEKK